MRTLITTGEALEGPSAQVVAEHLKRCRRRSFWLDITAPDDDDYDVLGRVFGFHPLTLEDIRHQNQRPKLDEYPGYAFVVLFQARLEAGAGPAFQEHHIFLGRGYVISVHLKPSATLSALQERLAANPELVRPDPGFLAYLVLDGLVDSLFPVLEKMDERIDALEARIAGQAGAQILGEVNRLKHQVIELRRSLGAEREIFQRLITHSLDFHDPALTVYWRDVYDHLVRQYETVDSLRDLLSSATDVYLSTISIRLNNTMKALTVIASLFLPLTFLTGFYGMNFRFLTNVLETPTRAFFFAIGTMVISVAIQIYYFRRRGWL